MKSLPEFIKEKGEEFAVVAKKQGMGGLARIFVKSFLTQAIKESYALALERAIEVAKSLRIEHPTICKVWDDENTHCTCEMSIERHNKPLNDLIFTFLQKELSSIREI